MWIAFKQPKRINLLIVHRTNWSSFPIQQRVAIILFSINVKEGKVETKQLRTGVHKTCDIYCNVCDTEKPVGWKYVLAE